MAVKNYVRIKFQPAKGPARWIWAIDLGRQRYKRVLADGSQCVREVVRADGVSVCTEELIIGEPIVKKPARMNLKYAELETDDD